MSQHQRIAFILSASFLVAFVAFGDIVVDVHLVDPAVSLGEPFDVTLQLTNTGDTTVITSDEALAATTLWPHLSLVRLLPDGTESPIVSDRPLLSPSPSALWIERNGVQVAVRPAMVIDPGASIDVRIANLLRYFPIVDPGEYRLRISLELPTYTEVFTDPAYGEVDLVAAYDIDAVLSAPGSVDFVLRLIDGLAEADVEWFRESRTSYLSAQSIESLVDILARPVKSIPYIRACSAYWTGEAYQLYAQVDRAIDAYDLVLSDHPESLFAGYAEDRLEEILGAK